MPPLFCPLCKLILASISSHVSRANRSMRLSFSNLLRFSSRPLPPSTIAQHPADHPKCTYANRCRAMNKLGLFAVSVISKTHGFSSLGSHRRPDVEYRDRVLALNSSSLPDARSRTQVTNLLKPSSFSAAKFQSRLAAGPTLCDSHKFCGRNLLLGCDRISEGGYAKNNVLHSLLRRACTKSVRPPKAEGKPTS